MVGPEQCTIPLNPQPSPPIDFVLISGLHHTGISQVCARFAQDFHLYDLDIFEYLQDLRDTSQHPREAYGHLHPDGFGEKFYAQLSRSEFRQNSAFTFFLIPVLKYKIELEVRKGWTGFPVSGLETSQRAAREFARKIAHSVAVFCFQDVGPGRRTPRTVMEQLFSKDEVISVAVDDSVEATYSSLVAETVGKYGMPSSPT